MTQARDRASISVQQLRIIVYKMSDVFQKNYEFEKISWPWQFLAVFDGLVEKSVSATYTYSQLQPESVQIQIQTKCQMLASVETQEIIVQQK
jgi:hypothetical protein